MLVFPGIFPATMRVAPNSPTALAKLRTQPAIMPFFARGRVMKSAVSNSFLPRIRDASSTFLSTAPMAAVVVFTIRGKETTKAAMAAACQVKRIPLPVSLVKILPITPFFPSRITRMYPVTVGGRTMGMVTITSASPFPGNSLFASI